MSKLQQLGLDSHILHWISNYLTCRCQKVVVNGETSREAPVLSGVPQGSVLGPLIYIDNLANVPVADGTQLVLYADDLLLYRLISNQGDYKILQNDIANWVSSNLECFKMQVYAGIQEEKPITPPSSKTQWM